MTFAMGGAPAPGSDRILVELFQILKDDAVESAALNMQYAGSRHHSMFFGIPDCFSYSEWLQTSAKPTCPVFSSENMVTQLATTKIIHTFINLAMT